jgi:hypothetical protein
MARIRVSENGRYFVDDGGAPFFWLGDTQWDLFRSFATEDARAVLERRKEQGFNAFQVMITGEGEGKVPNLAGETPWVDDDPATPNETYFEQVDRVIEIAGELDLIIVPGIFHQLQRDTITTSNARQYARWVAERYADASHVVWCMYPAAEPEFVPVLRELAAGLREGDGGAHMICVHPDPSPASSSFIHDEDWLDFNMIQTWLYYDTVYPMVSADYARTPPKPVVMAEGGYEGAQCGAVHTPHLVRKQAWWTCLAGGYHSYGRNENYASPETWRDWIDSPGAWQMGTCREILTGLKRWWDRVPDQSIFAEGEGSGAEINVASRAADGAWALAYLSGPTTVAIAMDKVAAGFTSNAFWIDPTSGMREPVGSFTNSGQQAFTTPEGYEDALIFFEGPNTDLDTELGM